MKYFNNGWLKDLFSVENIVTNKYEIIYLTHAKRVGIMKKHWLWSNSVLYYYKDREYLLKMDAPLFFKVLPDIEEIRMFHHIMSDDIINKKIEKFLKLRAFF